MAATLQFAILSFAAFLVLQLIQLISVKRLDEEGEDEPQTGKGDASDKIKNHPPTDKD